MAVLSMQAGGCPAAVLAGVKLILTPSLSAMFTRAGMLAPDGRCKTLDAAADGYVRGEALASLLLGLSDGLGAAPPLALLGSAVNQDGRSSSLTAPNGPQQQTAIRAALAAGGTHAAAVDVLQMHGTGTPLVSSPAGWTLPGSMAPVDVGPGRISTDPAVSHMQQQLSGLLPWRVSAASCPWTWPGCSALLTPSVRYCPLQGDPIEVGAAAAVLTDVKAAASRHQPLVLAADKSGIGHTEPAAGLSGAC